MPIPIISQAKSNEDGKEPTIIPTHERNWYYQNVLTRCKNPHTCLGVAGVFLALGILSLLRGPADAVFCLFIAVVWLERWAFFSVINAKDSEISKLQDKAEK